MRMLKTSQSKTTEKRVAIFKIGNRESGNGEWAGGSLQWGIFESGNL